MFAEQWRYPQTHRHERFMPVVARDRRRRTFPGSVSGPEREDKPKAGWPAGV
ncbi:hypothetical protein AZA_88182 [Nitrospirillum viridazoti Y2]|nr:hypothetical protein AZA_88182 [Nitrospirillum amazonense Y2]